MPHILPNRLFDELVAFGITHVVIAPGSRSAPLTLAAAKNPVIQTTVHWDERGLGFYALGLAIVTEKPVAVVTTSGTAVANLLPAVVEAFQSCVPLILLTADRPQRLQGTGANQTIYQIDIFKHFVRSSANLVSENSLDHTNAIRDCLASGQNPSGPIHFNCMFDEPLI